MSSKVKWGGIAGLVAAALLIISAILTQISPDTTASYLFFGVVLAAYIAVIVALVGIHALHSGKPRYGRLGTTGTVLTIAGYAVIGVVRVISMVQGQPCTPHRSPCWRRRSAHRLRTSRCDHYPCPVAAVVVRRTPDRGFPPRRRRERALQFRRESVAGLALGLRGHCVAVRRQEVDEPAPTQPAQDRLTWKGG